MLRWLTSGSPPLGPSGELCSSGLDALFECPTLILNSSELNKSCQEQDEGTCEEPDDDESAEDVSAHDDFDADDAQSAQLQADEEKRFFDLQRQFLVQDKSGLRIRARSAPSKSKVSQYFSSGSYPRPTKETRSVTPPAVRAASCNTGLNAALVDDVILEVLSFLTPSELRTMSSVSTSNFRLTQERHLWFSFLKKDWHLTGLHSFVTMKEPNSLLTVIGSELDSLTLRSLLCDKYSSSFSSSSSSSPPPSSFSSFSSSSFEDSFSAGGGGGGGDPLNLSILHALSGQHPTCVSDRFFADVNSCQCVTYSLDVPRAPSSSSSPLSPKVRVATVCQFVGQCAVGDRSLVSDKPFPTRRPASSESEDSRSSGGVGVGFASSSLAWRSLSYLLRGGVSRFGSYRFADASAVPSLPRPFVSPIVMSREYRKILPRPQVTCHEVDVTPRLIAYFEVTFHRRDAQQEARNHPKMLPFVIPPTLPPGVAANDALLQSSATCVAVGLSEATFKAGERLPGWDAVSYGYHGDDGGVFHDGGDMLRLYGPTFGAGDTVGCGIDFARQQETGKGKAGSGAIFFTINGKFLGYAFDDIDSGKALFPTVGVDTNNPIEINFGIENPFKFNLKGMLRNSADVVAGRMPRDKQFENRERSYTM